jgi:hypothetical protein
MTFAVSTLDRAYLAYDAVAGRFLSASNRWQNLPVLCHSIRFRSTSKCQVDGRPRLGGLNLGLVMGPDFPAMTGNLARNLRENRLGVLSAVLIRD